LAKEELFLLTADQKLSFQLRRLVAALEIQVVEANSIPVALDKLKNFCPHAMLVDLSLPRPELRHFLNRKSSVFSLRGVPFGLVGRREEFSSISPGEFGREASAVLLTLPLEPKQTQFAIRKLLKEVTHHSIEVKKSPYNGIQIYGNVAAEVIRLDEAGIMFRAAVRFDPFFEMNDVLISPVLKELGYDQARWVVISSQGSAEGFFTHVSFFGVTLAMAKKMRTFLENPG
jgi:hypothetical protein